MSKWLFLNDCHVGVQRSAGTTPESAAALKKYVLEGLRKNLRLAREYGCNTVLICGDLTDKFNLPLSDAWDLYSELYEFLANSGGYLVIALGNHDRSKDSSKLGTVEFIGSILSELFPREFWLVAKPYYFAEAGIHVIPHACDQVEFNAWLAEIPEQAKIVALHCNYDNQFAAVSDNSLNLSHKQARVLRDRGLKILIAHEHQQRDLMNGNLVIVGNQTPSSISDCLGNKSKRALIIEDGEFTSVETWRQDAALEGFKELDWRELGECKGTRFIRVVGTAGSDEAAHVVRNISNFRKSSSAFVISNAVAIEQLEGLESLAETAEDIRAVNVMDLLLDLLNEKERAAVQGLFGKVGSTEKTLEPT